AFARLPPSPLPISTIRFCIQGWPAGRSRARSRRRTQRSDPNMKRMMFLSAAAVVLSASAVWAGGLGLGCHCIQPPCEDCPDCSDGCCKHFRMPCLCGPEHAQCLIEKLCSGDCHERVKAARKLGCRLHADACACPDVINALVKALMCDTCWEVRQAAA